MLRYAYVSSGLSRHRLEDALELLLEAGYDGVALTLDHVHFDPLAPRLRARAERLGGLLDELGLARVVETDSRFLLDRHRPDHPSLLSEGRQRRLELLRRAVDVAAAVGAPVVSMRTGAAPRQQDPVTAWTLLMDGIESVLTAAGRGGGGDRGRARGRHARRAPRRLLHARPAPRGSGRLRAHARPRPLRGRGAGTGGGERAARGGAPAARARQGHAQARGRAADARRRRPRPAV